MTTIRIAAVNDASRNRVELAAVEAETNLSCVEIAEALCGTVSCYADANGIRHWHGLRNIWGFNRVEAPRLRDFLLNNGLEELEAVMVDTEDAGEMSSSCRFRVIYYLTWND